MCAAKVAGALTGFGVREGLLTMTVRAPSSDATGTHYYWGARLDMHSRRDNEGGHHCDGAVVAAGAVITKDVPPWTRSGASPRRKSADAQALVEVYGSVPLPRRARKVAIASL